MSRLPGWLRRLATIVLIAGSVAFIMRTVVVNSRQLEDFDWRVRVGLLALSVAAHVGVLAWGVFVWSRVLRHFARDQASYASLLRIWAVSNAAKYIPGYVWQFLAAARVAAASGMSQVVTLSSMIVHVVISLVSACVVAVLTLPLRELGISRELAGALMLAVPIAAAASVHPSLINFGLRLVPRAMHREVLGWHASWGEGLILLCLALASWVFYGVAYFLFLLALAPVPLPAFPAATGVNALSFVAGYLAFTAPGGLGVREWAMSILLTPLLPAAVAGVMAIAARLWSVVAELALAGIALVLRDRRGTHGTPYARVDAEAQGSSERG